MNETYDDGLSDGRAIGLVEAMRRLSAAGMHDGKCPEPERSCTCGIDAAIQQPPEGTAPVALNDALRSAWGRWAGFSPDARQSEKVTP